MSNRSSMYAAGYDAKNRVYFMASYSDDKLCAILEPFLNVENRGRLTELQNEELPLMKNKARYHRLVKALEAWKERGTENE